MVAYDRVCVCVCVCFSESDCECRVYSVGILKSYDMTLWGNYSFYYLIIKSNRDESASLFSHFNSYQKIDL